MSNLRRVEVGEQFFEVGRVAARHAVAMELRRLQDHQEILQFYVLKTRELLILAMEPVALLRDMKIDYFID